LRTIDDFSEVLLCDFEYYHGELTGGPPIPVCACALELRSGREYRLWTDELHRRETPWAHGRDVLFSSYNVTAELSCYLALDWPFPPCILDLLIEHRQLVNGVIDKQWPRDLLSAMRYHGLSGIEASAKEEWRDLILTGGPFDSKQRDGILAYCWTDIEATRELLAAMLKVMPRDLDRALFRGRYTIPATLSMCTGIPVDSEFWQRILHYREDIQREIVADCPVYEETTFKLDRFAEFLDKRGLLDLWPRTDSDRLSVEDRAFQRFSHVPAIEVLRQIRQVVDQLRKPGFQVHHGRNYYSILPFKAETSRNATIGCIFQAPRWLRGLVQPPAGTGLVYVDYETEEFYIAGVLAEDPAVIQAYASGDPYTAFGVMAGLIPPGGTKASYPNERGIAKTLALAVQYGMAAPSLAVRLGVSINRARDLLAAHRHIFRRLWRWSDAQVSAARWTGSIETTYGWRLSVNRRTKTRTLRNFKVQGAGAEILRLASILLHEAGIRVCAPVHDAFLIECPEASLAEVAEESCRQMTRASKYVLGGYELRTEARVLRYPERLIEPRGKRMWEHVLNITNHLELGSSVDRSVGRDAAYKE
jgi:hypothetical protein